MHVYDQLNVACLYRFCLHLHDLLEVCTAWSCLAPVACVLDGVAIPCSHGMRASIGAGAFNILRVSLSTDAPSFPLQNPTLRTKRIILFSADEPDKKANAALLMAL